MDADNEVVAYLRSLIDHYEECNLENCAECAVVRDACEYLRSRIFTSVPPVSPPQSTADRPARTHYRRLAGLR